MGAKLTGPACRAARALLGWSMRDLREASGVSLPTIQNIEGGGEFHSSTALKITEAFLRHNVEITNGRGTGARLVIEPAPSALPSSQIRWHVERVRGYPNLWTAIRDLPGQLAPVFEARDGVDGWAAAMGFVQSDVDPDDWFET